jgi:apolipoprotein N-acyltransferase
MEAKLEKTNTVKSGYLSYLWLVIGLLLFMVSNGRWIVPIATWLFPVFLIRFLRTQKRFWHIIICALAYIGVFMIAWKGLVPAPGVLYYIITGGIGLLFFVPFLIDKYVGRRVNGFIATLIFPLTYVTFEYVTSLLNPYGTWTFLGYTQFGDLPLMQMVSVTGIYGITFLITWFGSVVNWALEQQFSWSSIKRGAIIFTAVITIVLLLGGISLMFFSPKSDEVKIAGVQSDLPLTWNSDEELKKELEKLGETKDPSVNMSVEQWDYTIQKHKILIDDLFKKSEIAAKGGAKIISWAEATVMVYKEDVPAFLERGKQLAIKENIYFVMTYAAILNTDETLLPEKKLIENTAVIIGPSGDLLSNYIKSIPVPGYEAVISSKGDGNLPIVDTTYGLLATIICFENDFPAFNRKAADADIIFDPSGDWIEIDPYHTNMHAFRAIENGYSTFRITASGLSAAYDYQGRTLATMDYFKTKDLVFTAYLPTKGVWTVYSKIGDVFAWLSIAGLIAVLVFGLVRKRRSDLAKNRD